MKNITTVFILALLVISTSCVDDYTDANPPHQFDAPTIRLSTTANSNHLLVSNPVNTYQSVPEVFMTFGQPLEFTVSVIDAPGKIGDISVTSSIPEYGTVILDEASTSAISKQGSGDFKFTFTPSSDFEDETDRPFNIEVNVSDTQLDKDGKAKPKTTNLTIAVTIGKCLSASVQSGYYAVSQFTANEDGGDPIALEDLEGDIGERVVVKVSQERPGLYSLDDVTAGVWPIFYGEDALPVQVDLCETAISGHEGSTGDGQINFIVDGTANEDGTITITWTYVVNGGATPTDPAGGTYTLTRLGGL